MDKCKKFQDEILTGYIDGEMTPEVGGYVQDHLLTCPDCRAFAASVQADLVAPFKEATHQPVPEQVWLSIKEKIEIESRPGFRLWDALTGWLDAIPLPKLVPALMGLLILTMVGSGVFQYQQVKQAKETEQGTYLASLLDTASVATETDNGNAPTPIETYFL